MIDTHCHLWFPDFEGEVPQVIARAKEAGVHTLICVGCDEESSVKSIQLSKQYDNVFATVGIHPTEKASDFSWMEELLKEAPKKSFLSGKLPPSSSPCLPAGGAPKPSRKDFFGASSSASIIVAVGEIGLDYYHQPFDKTAQQTMFEQQCRLAKSYDLPVLIHLRSSKESKSFSTELTQAEKDCLQILDKVGLPKVLFHCFSGDRTMAEEVLKRGWLLSFSGVLTFPRALELREVVKMCPLDRMVVETDSPFLAPSSRRGKRNEPAFVVETAATIAELKQLPRESIEEATDRNVVHFFQQIRIKPSFLKLEF